MIKVLFTKKIAQQKLDKQLTENFQSDSFDFIQIEYLDLKKIKSEINSKTKLYIVSSIRAAKCAVKLGLNGTYYVVGEKSAELLRKNNYKVEHIALTAKDLVSFFDSNVKEVSSFNFLCSKIRGETIPNGLKKLGHQIHEIVCYNTFSKSIEIENNYDAYAFFSPSGVKSYFKQYDIPEKACIFAIGETTAKEIKKWTKKEVLISNIPETKPLLQTIKEYFHAKK